MKYAAKYLEEAIGRDEAEDLGHRVYINAVNRIHLIHGHSFQLVSGHLHPVVKCFLVVVHQDQHDFLKGVDKEMTLLAEDQFDQHLHMALKSLVRHLLQIGQLMLPQNSPITLTQLGLFLQYQQLLSSALLV